MNARNMSICVYKNFELSRAFPYERITCEENAKLQIMEWEDTKVEYSMSPLGFLWMK